LLSLVAERRRPPRWHLRASAHAAPCLRLQAGKPGGRYTIAAALPRPQEYPAHRALHRAFPGQVPKFLEGLAGPHGAEHVIDRFLAGLRRLPPPRLGPLAPMSASLSGDRVSFDPKPLFFSIRLSKTADVPINSVHSAVSSLGAPSRRQPVFSSKKQKNRSKPPATFRIL